MGAREDVAGKSAAAVTPMDKGVRKRRRILLACTACRARKQRCDGSQPTCEHCTIQKLDCHYESASQKADVTQLYVHNLLKRIDQLEEEISGTRLAKCNGDLAGLRQQHHDSGSSFSMAKDPNTRPAHDEQSPQHTPPLSWPRHGCDRSHDAVGERALPGSDVEQVAHHAADFLSKSEEPPTQGYLGAASTLTFCQVVLEQEDPLKQRQDLELSNTPRRAEIGPQGSRWNKTIPLNDLADSWPQRYLGDHLVDCFIDLCYPQYPFIHGPTFKRHYESMWTSRERQTDAWIATVNSVFALGCQYSPTISPNLGGQFFRKATFLINFEGLGECTLEYLQALVLMSLYLQGSANLNHSWNVIGLAVRQAQSLGLHLQKTYQRVATPAVREAQKRVWAACYVLDSVSAMMLGRPPIIAHDARVLIEGMTLLDDDQIPTGRSLPPLWPGPLTPGGGVTERLDFAAGDERPYEMAFFTATIRHCGFMRDMVKLYDMRSEHSVSLELDESFCQWMADIPSHLHPSNTSSTDQRLWQQRIVLTSRFLNLRILSHRLCVLRMAPIGKTATPFEPIRGATNEKLASLRAEVCISAAIEQIQHISRSYKQGSGSAWWYDLNYIFSAVSILLATQIMQQHCDSSYSHYVKLAEDVIREMHKTGRSLAGRYMEMLEQLQRRLAYKTSPQALQRGQYSQGSRSTSPSRRNQPHECQNTIRNVNSVCDSIRELADEELGDSLTTLVVPDLSETIRDEDMNSLFASSSFPWSIDPDTFLLDDDTLHDSLHPTEYDTLV